jgi:hypothetical protein
VAQLLRNCDATVSFSENLLFSAVEKLRRHCGVTVAQLLRHTQVTKSVADTFPERMNMFILLRQQFL